MPRSDTQFKPGQIANPTGRPKGECKKYKLFKQLVEPRTDELVNQALNIALSSDKDRTKVLTLFLERVMPAVVKDNILNPEIELSEGSLVEQANHIRSLITDKHITPEQGNVLLASVKATAEIKYKEDLEKELEELKSEFKTFRDKFGK